jgi:class 3 adenylate cyclase
MEIPEEKKSKVLKKVDVKQNEISKKTKTDEQSAIKLNTLGADASSLGKTPLATESAIKLSSLGADASSLGKTLLATESAIKLSSLGADASSLGKALLATESATKLSSLASLGKTFSAVSETMRTVSNLDSLKYDGNVYVSSNIGGMGSKLSHWGTFTQPSSDNQMKLIEEITELKRKLLTATKELTAEADDKQNVMTQLTQLTEELQAKEKINHIIPRIREEARKKLLESSEFLGLFNDAKSCEAVVVSIDIRRSTELMLKARKPELFSKFITELSSKLSENIISNYGIFDKFTGDGILAFFPKFYSGDEAIIRALKSAEECHEIFDKHYHNSKSCFNVFINDVGLGIGIDYGTVTLVNTSNELTVVGIPVVYACRMSGAKAGDTILNQPAKEEIERLCATQIKITDTTILIKNEGTAEVYKVDVNPSVYKVIVAPSWTIDVQNKEDEVEVNSSTNDEVSE